MGHWIDQGETMTRKAAYARLLTLEDLPEIKRVFNSHPTVMKIPVTEEYRAQHFAELEKYLTEKQIILYWGAFDTDHKLCSYLVQEYSMLRPAWYLKLLVTDIEYSSRPLSMRHSGLGLCVDKAITAAESYEYFEWLYSVVLDRYSTRAKIWTSQSQMVNRYTFYIETVFPPDAEPRFSYQKTLMTDRVRDRSWAIKKASLKAEHRFEILNTKGKLDLTYKDVYND
jgi:hypothetical protein